MNNGKVTLPRISDAAKDKNVEHFENQKEEAGLASETFAAVAGVLPERSVIVQLQQHRIAPSNFFRRFLRTRINDYDDGSMIVLDSRFDNGEQINRLGTVVNNYCQGRGSGRRDDRCCRQPAFCMIVISVVQVLFYIWDVTKSKTAAAESYGGPMTSTFIYDPRRRREIWRFFTYTFVHVRQTSLGINLIVQLLLGVPLETVHRGRKVAAVYFSGVFAGSLATSVTYPSARLAGATAGVYALIAAHVATVIVNWSDTKFAVYQMSAFAFLTTIDVVGQSVHRGGCAHHDQDDRRPAIDFVALLAGTVAGLLIGVYALRDRRRRYCSHDGRSWDNELCCWFCRIVYAASVASAIAWHLTFPEYFFTGEPPRDSNVV